MSDTAQKRTIFDRLTDGRWAAAAAEEAIGEILGVELLGISFDDYDESFEVFVWEDVEDVEVTQEMHEAMLALGCSRYWINFKDGTERYCRGERKKAAIHNRWELHSRFQDDRRSRTEELSRLRAECEQLRADALRYRHLKRFFLSETEADDGTLRVHYECSFEHYDDLDASLDEDIDAAREQG